MLLSILKTMMNLLLADFFPDKSPFINYVSFHLLCWESAERESKDILSLQFAGESQSGKGRVIPSYHTFQTHDMSSIVTWEEGTSHSVISLIGQTTYE